MAQAQHGTGRRKSAIARVYAKSGTGRIVINNKQLEDYFGRKPTKWSFASRLSSSPDGEDGRSSVAGGGPTGQARAIRHGDPRPLEFRRNLAPAAAQAGYVTVTREVERKSRPAQSKAPSYPSVNARRAGFPACFQNWGSSSGTPDSDSVNPG